MNKVGIMTWFRYENYGTALQATALYKTVKQFGYQPIMIDYTPKGKTVERKTVTDPYVINRFIEKIQNYNKGKLSSAVSECLSDYITKTFTVSEPCKTYPELKELVENYDAVVCGSDQIWSPLCFDANYYLPFVTPVMKKVAYAPSIGSDKLSNNLIAEKMAKLLSEFGFLSVREQKGADIIKQLTGLEAKVVVDPTLLMNREEWQSTLFDLQKTMKMPEKYIIGYFLGNNENYFSYIKRLSKMWKVPAYIIPVCAKQSNKVEPVPFTVGPSEFVSLIMHASFVCTDSFHGMAFSCNFNTPFAAFERFKNGSEQSQNSRIHNLLDTLNLQWRLCSPTEKINDERLLSADFQDANARLEKLRISSKEYLKTALQNSTGSKNCDAKKKKLYQITSLCCGCGACGAVCPKSAIIIDKDENGFEHCQIDDNLCIKCGNCKTVCPFVHVTADTIKSSIALYSAKSKDNKVLKHSSSGGVAYALTESFGHNGYRVCGVQYNPEWNGAEHVLAKPLDTLQWHKFQGSKYIQSVSAPAIREIVETQGKYLFFGTPCQVAGLDKVLRFTHQRDEAILVDLICHGVPSQLLWNKYIEQTASRHHLGNHPDVSFRDKTNGNWRRLRLLLSDSTGTHIYRKDEKKDDFYAFFRRGYCYMETCFECPYREKSAADIRVGDYWGTRFDSDTTGVSMVIANTNAGLSAIEKLSNDGKIELCPQELEDFWTVQFPQNANRPVFREELLEQLKESSTSLHNLRKHYCQLADAQELFSDFIQRLKKVLQKG